MMLTALMIFLGVSAGATTLIVAGVMVAARRPIPAYSDEMSHSIVGGEFNTGSAGSSAAGVALA
jgi:hypothetical protein